MICWVIMVVPVLTALAVALAVMMIDFVVAKSVDLICASWLVVIRSLIMLLPGLLG